MKPLNILYLHSHDAGRYASPYGYAMPTPNLQRFAEQGVTLRRAFCAAPSCSPSRAAMLTGQYPHQNGMFGLASEFRLHDEGRHLVNWLAQQGYTTALAGIQHETAHDEESTRKLGYQEVLTTDDNGNDQMPGAAMAAERFLLKKREEPFFLSVGVGEPHRDNSRGGGRFSYLPGIEQLEIDDRYCRPPEPVPDTPKTRSDMANFAVAMQVLDRKFGHVLDALKRSGQEENTLVIITTDHGIAWPHGKGNLTDMGTGVMLMVRGPGEALSGGRVVDGMVEQLDLWPTLCELLDLPRPDWLEGQSFLPVLRGAEGRECVFTEQNWHSRKFDPQRAVRTDRYKLIRRKETGHLRIVDPGPTNDWMRSIGFADSPTGTELLYDLWLDPLEMVNRAEDPAYAGVRADLAEKLDQWMNQTGDPFPADAIPEPPPQ